MALSGLIGGVTGTGLGSAQTVYSASAKSAIKVMNFFNSSASVNRTIGIHLGNTATVDNQIREYTLEPKETRTLALETFIFDIDDKIFVWETSGSGDVKVVISDFEGL